MKIDELRKKNQVELQQALDELAKERFSGLNPKPHLFRENKISIARVKTVLKEMNNGK